MKKLAALPLVVVLAACGDGATSLGPAPKEKRARPQASSPTRPRMMPLKIWLVQGKRLVERDRAAPETVRVATAAVRKLLAGPTQGERRASNITTAIPGGTRLIGIAIEDGIATIDLTSQYQAGAGSHSMQLRLAQIVYTLTQFPTVKKVQFELDGSPVNVFSSEGIVLDKPVRRADYENLNSECAGISPSRRGFVVVNSPRPGDHVGPLPFSVRGCSSAFEGTISWTLKAKAGDELASGHAQGGSLEPDEFVFRVHYTLDKGAPGVLEVFEPPASGEGGPTSQVVVPLVLAARP